jgi:hypothetical protein
MAEHRTGSLLAVLIEIEVPEPLETRTHLLDAPHRFKMWRGGRRAAKTRHALHACFWGHGPGTEFDRPWHGLVQGKDVAWLAPDYPQGATVWQEEILANYGGKPGWTVSEKHKSLTLDGYGTFYLYSAENVDAIRGRGKRLGGVVVDEGAHLNLRDALQQVIMPALTDCEGWLIVPSTPNAGPDGGLDEAGHRRSPSYFNTLCGMVMGGEMGTEWGHWHFDARSNPVISARAFDSLVALYAKDSPALREEVYAELLVGGLGLCFKEWDPTVHLQALEPDTEDACAMGMDWGHGTPGWAGEVYTRPDGRLLMRREWYFKGMRAKKVGYRLGKMCLAATVEPEYVALDSACFATTGIGATIAEKIEEGMDAAYARYNREHGASRQAPPLIAAPKGKDALVTQTALIREVLGWERDADGVLVEPPQLVVHPDCRDFARTIAVLPLDPHDPNKFDTRAEDHPVQGLAYLLGIRAPEYRAPAVPREVREQRAKLDGASRREAESWDKMAAKAEQRYRAMGGKR